MLHSQINKIKQTLDDLRRQIEIINNNSHSSRPIPLQTKQIINKMGGNVMESQTIIKHLTDKGTTMRIMPTL